MLIIILLGGALSGWSVLLVLSGERQRKLSQSVRTAPPITQIKKN
jgi:hypothetical protein